MTPDSAPAGTGPPRAVDAREVGAGAVFLAFGVFVMGYAREYDLGTATQMGPGYFPTLLGGLLVLLGGTAIVLGLRRGVQTGIGAWPVVPGLFILSGVLAFALLIRERGLVPAVIAAVLLGCYERFLHRPVEIATITAALLAITVGIFFYGIQLPVRLW